MLDNECWILVLWNVRTFCKVFEMKHSFLRGPLVSSPTGVKPLQHPLSCFSCPIQPVKPKHNKCSISVEFAFSRQPQQYWFWGIPSKYSPNVESPEFLCEVQLISSLIAGLECSGRELLPRSFQARTVLEPRKIRIHSLARIFSEPLWSVSLL